MQAVRRESSTGRSPPNKPIPSLHICKAGHHHKANKPALDLQSISTNCGSITTSGNSSSEGWVALNALEHGEAYLAKPGDHVHFLLRSHPEWFSTEGHKIRTAEFLAAFDEQFSSGRAVIKLPYRDETDFDESKPPLSRPPSLASELSTISTALGSVTLEPIEGVTVAYRPVTWPPPTTPPPPTGGILSENFKRQESLLVTENSDDETYDEDTSAASTEGRSERSNAFELLDSAIIKVLAPDARLAANVIAHLYKLPANLRSLVYGFITHGSEGGGSSNSANPPPEQKSRPQNTVHKSQQPDKKRKINQEDDEYSEDRNPKEPRGRVRVHSTTRIVTLKYACPFNIMDPKRYCVRNELGGTGDLYSSCMGTGWTDLRGLLGHLRDHHRPVQCTRCWTIFDELEQLTFHRDKMVHRCDDFSLLIECREGIDPDKWTSVEKALKTPRSKVEKRKSPLEKWMEMWDILFPASLYPNLPRPKHPYYVDPEIAFDFSTSSPETDRRLLIAKGIWDSRIAASGASEDEYHPGWGEVEQIIREADAILSDTSQQPFQPTPNQEPNSYSNADDGIERPDESHLHGHTTNIAEAGTQFAFLQEWLAQEDAPAQLKPTSQKVTPALDSTMPTLPHPYDNN